MDSVSVSFTGGKIHALVGENGAGKSTLAGIISGDIQPTGGDILLDEEVLAFSSAKDALSRGIVLVHQRPKLASAITAKENIILQLQTGGKRQPFFLHAPSAELLALQKEWAPQLNLNAVVRDLGGNLRFYTSLLGALLQKPKVLLLDEPSAFLDMDERQTLYAHLRSLADSGTNIIVITHSRAEATKYADTVTMLKLGRLAGYFPTAGEYEVFLSESDRQLSANEPYLQPAESADRNHSSALELNLSSRPKNRPALLSASIQANYGEITAVTGLQEAALDTLEDTITGMETSWAKGSLTITDETGSHTIAANRLSPGFLRSHKVAIVPSDKTFRAANPNITVEELLSVYTKTEPRQKAAALIREAHVNITPEQFVSNLSGGMLQRLIVTRELSTSPDLLILCNPMQGLDIEAQGNLCHKLTDLTAKGKAVIIIGTQDFPLTLCQKVYRLESGCTELIFENGLLKKEENE